MNTPTEITLNKEKILQQVEDLAVVAKESAWEYDYDADLDQMIYGKEYMPRDSFLFKINDEINLFISPDSTINGIQIEYFNGNFLAHNKELIPAFKAIKNQASTQTKENAEKVLEAEFMADTLKSLFNRTKLVTAL